MASMNAISPDEALRRKRSAIDSAPEDSWGTQFLVGECTEGFTSTISCGTNVLQNTGDIAGMGKWIRATFDSVYSIRSSFLVSSARIREIIRYVDMDACSRSGIDVRNVKPVVLWLQKENHDICLLGRTSAVFVLMMGVQIGEDKTEWQAVPVLTDILEEDAYVWLEEDHRLLSRLKRMST